MKLQHKEFVRIYVLVSLYLKCFLVLCAITTVLALETQCIYLILGTNEVKIIGVGFQRKEDMHILVVGI